MTNTTHRHVVVTDQETGLPYSKGLMASRIMATGLSPARAYHVAEVIEERLHAASAESITTAELHDLALDVLRDEAGDRHAASFAAWSSAAALDLPLVVLIGGATGVGKSTIATMLAGRLGVTRVIPTDAIREVMRSMFSEELMPTLHASSFEAARAVRTPLPRSADPVIIGFREQASAVAVGIEALIRRAADESTALIVEGAHLVPGFFDLEALAGRAIVVPVLVTVDDEEQHRSHFLAREAGARPSDRYLQSFTDIRKLQRFLTSLALEHGVPIVRSYSLDATVAQVIDLVVHQAVLAVPSANDTANTNASKEGAR